MAELGNINFASSIITTNPNVSDAEITDNETAFSETTTASTKKKQGFFSRIFGSKKQVNIYYLCVFKKNDICFNFFFFILFLPPSKLGTKQ